MPSIVCTLRRCLPSVVVNCVLGALLIPTTWAADEQKPKSEAAAKKAADAKEPANAKKVTDAKKLTDKDGWSPLFNGKNLDGWKNSNFGGQEEASVEDGEIVIPQGAELSGIFSESKTLPKINYEIQYEAQRAAGSDFFAGLTFPVNDSYCSLILGGWGGGLCGLSSLDGMDASENQTTSYRQFEKGKWYKIRLTVTEEKIQAWIDGDQIVDVDTKDHRISVRFEVEKSKPLGFATWQTMGRIRNARMRDLPTAKKPDAASKDQ